MSDSMHQGLITPAGERAVCLRPKLQMEAYACSITDFDIISDLGHVESSCGLHDGGSWFPSKCSFALQVEILFDGFTALMIIQRAF